MAFLGSKEIIGNKKQEKFAEEIRTRLNSICGDVRRPFTEDSLPLVAPALDPRKAIDK